MALVITNLFSAIPFVGQDIVQWLWGGFSVSNPTIQRFFALHYLVPFIIAALVIMHFIALHVHGSSNPLGITGNLDRLPMHGYFVFKDLITVFVFLIAFSLFVFYSPNTIGHPDNYIPGNPLVTPASINKQYIYILIIIIIININLYNNNKLNNIIYNYNKELYNNTFIISLYNKSIINKSNKLNNKIIKRIFISLTILNNKLLIKNKDLNNNINNITLYDKIKLINIIKDYNLVPSINNKLIKIRKLLLNINLLSNLNSNKEIIKDLLNIPLNKLDIIKLDNISFKNLINGLFQAEGHIGYEFYTLLSYKGRPIVFIQLNASLESIILFKQFNNIFNNIINYLIYLNNSGYYSIRIYSRNINFIINKFKPYINNVYGDKFRGLLFLIKIHYLLTIPLDINIKKIIYLVYNLIDNSQRKLLLLIKINIVLNNNNNNDLDNNYYNNYIKNIININHNPYKFNICWLLGFFIGDGSLITYIKNNKIIDISLPLYIIELKISQKYTEDNIKLLNLISNNLINQFNIKTKLRLLDNKYEIIILNHIELNKLINLFKQYNNYWYLRKHQLTFLSKFLSLKRLSKYWIIGSLLRINLLREFIILQYNNRLLINNSKRLSLITIKDIELYLKDLNINYNIEHIKLIFKYNNDNNKYYFPKYLTYSSLILLLTLNYYNNIIKVFDNKYKDLPIFIHKYKNKGYFVSLPIKLLPKIKYFYFSLTLNTLYEAIKYKNNLLYEWLINNKLL